MKTNTTLGGSQMTTIKTIVEGLEERAEELRLAMIMLNDGKSADGKTIKDSTVNTMRHHTRRDQRIVALTLEMAKKMDEEGITGLKLSEAASLGFTQLAFPEKGGTRVTVDEGDSILALMEKYPDTKDLMAKLIKAAENIGCVLDFKTGKVVRS